MRPSQIPHETQEQHCHPYEKRVLCSMTDVQMDYDPVLPRQYAKEWQQHRYWRKAWLGQLIGYIPGIMLLDYIADRFFGDTSTAIGVATLVWLFSWAVASHRFFLFRCPRCGVPFYYPKNTLLLLHANLFAKYCWNCELDKWEGE